MVQLKVEARSFKRNLTRSQSNLGKTHIGKRKAGHKDFISKPWPSLVLFVN